MEYLFDLSEDPVVAMVNQAWNERHRRMSVRYNPDRQSIFGHYSLDFRWSRYEDLIAGYMKDHVEKDVVLRKAAKEVVIRHVLSSDVSCYSVKRMMRSAPPALLSLPKLIFVIESKGEDVDLSLLRRASLE
jgi:hypothetical protein